MRISDWSSDVCSSDLLALRLQLRLQRLNAMREAGARLLARDRIGRDVFIRPDPEGLHTIRKVAWKATIFDLISSYGQIQARARPAKHIVARRARKSTRLNPSH